MVTKRRMGRVRPGCRPDSRGDLGRLNALEVEGIGLTSRILYEQVFEQRSLAVSFCGRTQAASPHGNGIQCGRLSVRGEGLVSEPTAGLPARLTSKRASERRALDLKNVIAGKLESNIFAD